MNDNIMTISDANNLIDAFNKAKKDSIWKNSSQKYEANLLLNTYHLRKSLRDGTYKQKPFYEFTLNERGKVRYIKSMHISDRVVQRSLCDNVLMPKLEKYLIYDNGASMKNKGLDFARRRLDCHLHKFYRENKSNDGYILLVDFSKFFDNIRHDKLIEMLESKIKDKKFMNFVKQLISSFNIDVSYLNEEDYKNCINELFNSLEYNKIDKRRFNGSKLMEKSIGIGSQISQICGIYFPTRLDNYCKIVKSLKYYGRYMDDFYVIHKSKKYLCNLLNEINVICKYLGLFINMKKTGIVKISHGFTFLKIRYNLTSTGSVIKRLSNKTITRERRRLKKYKRMLDEGRLDFKHIEMCYKSWKGNALHYKCYKSVRELDKLFDKLFVYEWRYIK